MTRNYRTPKAAPVTVEEVSAHIASTPAGAIPAMLRDAVRQTAGWGKIPVTLWPSRWTGRNFQGPDCLLAIGSMCGRRPEDAAPDARPVLSVLPGDYLRSNALHIEDLKRTALDGGSTDAEAAEFSRWVIREEWLCLGDLQTPYRVWRQLHAA